MTKYSKLARDIYNNVLYDVGVDGIIPIPQIERAIELLSPKARDFLLGLEYDELGNVFVGEVHAEKKVNRTFYTYMHGDKKKQMSKEVWDFAEFIFNMADSP